MPDAPSSFVEVNFLGFCIRIKGGDTDTKDKETGTKLQNMVRKSSIQAIRMVIMLLALILV
jgi:hypothetical protein